MRSYPEVAGDLFERELTFRNFNISLDRTVQGYNRLKVKTHQREYDLISNELSEVDLMLERAEHALNWNSEGNLTFSDQNLIFLMMTHCAKNHFHVQKLHIS